MTWREKLSEKERVLLKACEDYAAGRYYQLWHSDELVYLADKLARTLDAQAATGANVSLEGGSWATAEMDNE